MEALEGLFDQLANGFIAQLIQMIVDFLTGLFSGLLPGTPAE